MPSPLRKGNAGGGGGGGDSSVAYTRWEAVDSDEHASLQLPFSEFEEEEAPHYYGGSNSSSINLGVKLQAVLRWAFGGNGDASSNNNSRDFKPPRQRHHPAPQPEILSPQAWAFTARFLFMLIIFGVGWIMGFLVRWGIHEYYVDPLGHCVTPNPYRYSQPLAEWATKEVNFSNVRSFFDEFTSDPHHRPGSPESARFAEKVRQSWIDFGLQKVEVEEVDVAAVPAPEAKRRELTVWDREGKAVVQRIPLTGENSAEVAYSASAIGKGPLLYAHLGRVKDFADLSAAGFNFSGSVAAVRLRRGAAAAADAVANARRFGCAAAVLFPDPLEYAGLILDDEALARSVKARPGDPSSPYFVGGGSVPDIPVVSVSPRLARHLLTNYTRVKGVPEYMKNQGLPLGEDENRSFQASVEVEVLSAPAKLLNVIGSIPGRYEPTRYVLIGSHHDTWSRGASKPANAHSVLMEMVRALGNMFRHGWRPGRSLVFASWDGEELGSLGSTAWMNHHAKELQSRAVAYINLDHRGDSTEPVEGSPLFSAIMKQSAKSIPCEDQDGGGDDDDCNLFEEWLRSSPLGEMDEKDWRLRPTTSHFSSILGVSSVDVSLKKLREDLPRAPTPLQVQAHHHSDGEGGGGGSAVELVDSARRFLDSQHRHSAQVARFAVVLALRLASSPHTPLSAAAYAGRVHEDLHSLMVETAADIEGKADVKKCMEDISRALSKLEKAASRFHDTYDSSNGQLELLGHHEFSDQLMEMERSMLVNAWGEADAGVWAGEGRRRRRCPHPFVASSPHRHALYGPSPLDGSSAVSFPRLRAALSLAKSLGEQEKGEEREEGQWDLWECVRREMFFVADALDSATCLLDNHLVYTYAEQNGGKK